MTPIRLRTPHIGPPCLKLATVAVRAAVQLIFQLTAVERILGITDARNCASVAVLERVGMRKQEERNAVFRDELCVEHVYARLRSDSTCQE